jgi:hypothetical protein
MPLKKRKNMMPSPSNSRENLRGEYIREQREGLKEEKESNER